MHRSVVIFLLVISYCSGYRKAFDQDLYKDVIDEASCSEQLELLESNSMSFRFIDASGKFPTGISYGNVNDLGDYYSCLDISMNITGVIIEGKYSGILIPLNTSGIDDFTLPPFPTIPDGFTLPTLPDGVTLPELPPDLTLPPGFTLPDNEEVEEMRYRRHTYLRRTPEPEFEKSQEEFFNLQTIARTMAGVGMQREEEYNPDMELHPNMQTRIFPLVITLRDGAFLGVCIPKPCTAKQAVDYFVERLPFTAEFEYDEYFYRLPNDKPFAPADYVAFAIFSLIICFVIASTGYDLYCTLILKVSPNKSFCCFSVYTNTRRLLTFKSSPGSLECVDGIRSISMMWVVIGHTYSMTLLGYVQNVMEALEWLRLFTSTWVNSAPLTVDTFFLLSGILAVYTTVGKISKGRFIRTIHLFYINRFLRMFPLLGAVILLQASFFNHVSDGPFWINPAEATENCRTYWWSALLHVQNYVNPLKVCIPQTWYLSVDTQLYLLCPIVIVCLFGSPLIAWSALTFVLLLSLVSSSVYSFLYNFTAALVQPNRVAEFADYLETYYFNTLTRAPPFVVGLFYGYILHLYRGKKVVISKVLAGFLWFFAAVLMLFCLFSIYPVMQIDWDKQAFDNFLNAYMRSLWAVAVGWMIFACVHGYGGPVNWFLSLSVWKLPARLSFAMYLIHVPVMIIANGSWTSTYYFRNGHNIYRYMSDLSITFIAAFVLCVCIDAPFSTLQKLLMNGGGKKKRPARGPRPDEEKTKPDPLDISARSTLDIDVRPKLESFDNGVRPKAESVDNGLVIEKTSL